MESFVDDVSEITWYKDDCGYEANQLSKELNSWNSKSIEKYVSGGWELGDLTRDIVGLNKNMEQFYGFVDNKFVSTILLKEGEPIPNELYYDLLTHIQNNRRGIIKQDEKTIISTDRGFELLDKQYMDEVSYLVVNPQFQKKGYGTRVVSSIKENLGLFMPDAELSTLTTQIHYKNKPSMKCFERAGFKQLNVPINTKTNLNNFFLEEMDMER